MQFILKFMVLVHRFSQQLRGGSIETPSDCIVQPQGSLQQSHRYSDELRNTTDPHLIKHCFACQNVHVSFLVHSCSITSLFLGDMALSQCPEF